MSGEDLGVREQSSGRIANVARGRVSRSFADSEIQRDDKVPMVGEILDLVQAMDLVRHAQSEERSDLDPELLDHVDEKWHLRGGVDGEMELSIALDRLDFVLSGALAVGF